MNTAWNHALCGGLAVGLGSLVAISTPATSVDNGERAVAIALEDDLSWLLETLPVEEDGVLYTSIPLCLAIEPKLDFALLNASFDQGKIAAEPIERCTSLEPGEGVNDSAFPQYLHPNQEQALDLAIEVKCHGESRCVVEIDSLYRKDRYTVLRQGSHWRIWQSENLILRNISPAM